MTDRTATEEDVRNVPTIVILGQMKPKPKEPKKLMPRDHFYYSRDGKLVMQA